MTKLKPCPFCSAEDASVHDDRDRSSWVVECGVCGASATGASKEGAIGCWNTRADDPQWIELPEGWAGDDDQWLAWLDEQKIESSRQALFFDPRLLPGRQVHAHLAFEAFWACPHATHIAKWTPPKGPNRTG